MAGREVARQTMALRKAYPQDAWDGLGRQVSLLTEALMARASALGACRFQL